MKKKAVRQLPPFRSQRRERFFKLSRWYSERSHSLYQDRLGFVKRGSDPVDAERFRLAAKFCRSLGLGTSFLRAFADFMREWVEFCSEMKAKVDAAPKIRSGPMAGCSAIHYKHADPGAIDAVVIQASAAWRDLYGVYPEGDFS